MRNSVFVLLLIFTALISSGQYYKKLQYKKASIITYTDTIVGFIKKSHGYQGKVKYKLDWESDNLQKIKGSEIKSIKSTNFTYDRINYDDKSLLMRLYKKGIISIYIYEHYAYYHQSGSKSEIEQKFLVKGDTAIPLKRAGLKDDLKELMWDAEELFGKIDELKYGNNYFDYNLNGIISEYNLMKLLKGEENNNIFE